MPKSATSALAVVEQDVLRLDVAMDDAVPVGVVERVGDLAAMRTASAIGELRLARRAGRGAISPSTKGIT